MYLVRAPRKKTDRSVGRSLDKYEYIIIIIIIVKFDANDSHPIQRSMTMTYMYNNRGVGTGGQGGGRPPKKLGRGRRPPPKRKNTERRRKMTKVHCAPPEALGAPRPKGKAEEKTTVLKTEGATLYKYVYMFNGI